MRDAIERKLKAQRRLQGFRWLAAASVLLLALAGWLLFPVPPSQKVTLAAVNKTIQQSPAWKTISNTTSKPLQCLLPDGSVVQLARNAVVQYPPDFGRQQRLVHLQGQADFDVAHNKAKPFTVQTKLFATTALGTAFRVIENGSACSVQLFRGKVLVKPVMPALKGWTKDIVLLPGQHMRYRNGTVTVSEATATRAQPLANRHTSKVIEHSGSLVFNNAPLQEVMTILAKQYDTPILYERRSMQGKYFSGEVRSNDSLPALLKIIANMNALQVSNKDGKYFITEAH